MCTIYTKSIEEEKVFSLTLRCESTNEKNKDCMLTYLDNMTVSRSQRVLGWKKVDGEVVVYITRNNGIGTLLLPDQTTLYTTSAGAQGFRGARRGTTAALFAVGVALAEKSKSLGILRVNVSSKGMGKARIGFLRGLVWGGLTLVSLHDVTPRPHNGCRPPSIRRL